MDEARVKFLQSQNDYLEKSVNEVTEKIQFAQKRCIDKFVENYARTGERVFARCPVEVTVGTHYYPDSVGPSSVIPQILKRRGLVTSYEYVENRSSGWQATFNLDVNMDRNVASQK
jgi:hypothetical protein